MGIRGINIIDGKKDRVRGGEKDDKAACSPN